MIVINYNTHTLFEYIRNIADDDYKNTFIDFLAKNYNLQIVDYIADIICNYSVLFELSISDSMIKLPQIIAIKEYLVKHYGVDPNYLTEFYFDDVGEFIDNLNSIFSNGFNLFMDESYEYIYHNVEEYQKKTQGVVEVNFTELDRIMEVTGIIVNDILNTVLTKFYEHDINFVVVHKVPNTMLSFYIGKVSYPDVVE